MTAAAFERPPGAEDSGLLRSPFPLISPVVSPSFPPFTYRLAYCLEERLWYVFEVWSWIGAYLLIAFYLHLLFFFFLFAF